MNSSSTDSEKNGFINFIKKIFKLIEPTSDKKVIESELAELEERFKSHLESKEISYLTTYSASVSTFYNDLIKGNVIGEDKEKVVGENKGKDKKKAKYDEYIKVEDFPAKEYPIYGLALSGGGIRSAAFGIGVTQALNTSPKTEAQNTESDVKRATLFDKLMYLSTVSGGGYAGSALTWFMKQHEKFPFGNIENFCGSKNEPGAKNSVELIGFIPKWINNLFSGTASNSNESDNRKENLPNEFLSHIRLHGKYLTPPELPITTFIASIINSILHSLTAYTLIISLPILLALYLSNTQSHVKLIENIPLIESLKNSAPINDFLQIYNSETKKEYKCPNQPSIECNSNETLIKIPIATDTKQAIDELSKPEKTNLDIRKNFTLLFIYLSFIGAVLFATTSIIVGFLSYATEFFSKNYKLRVKIQRTLGIILIIEVTFILVALIPWLLTHIENKGYMLMLGTGGAGTGITAIVMAIIEFQKQLSNKNESSFKINIMKSLVVIAFIYLIFIFTYFISEQIHTSSNNHLILYLLFAALFVFVVNINNVSPHRVYRDRLMDTFLTDLDIPSYKSIAKKGAKANSYSLVDIDKNKNWSPYHLINTNIILNNSPTPQFNSRLGDSFLLSPKYCGSNATGYVPTKDFAYGSMSLATAMSISGAAANPHSGVSGVGSSTTPLVSFLMTFFGLRLGYWANNPKHWLVRFKLFFRPNYFLPGTFSLLNFGHTEDAKYIELSDGGHFENTGIYELIRRRVPWIILSDGSADLDTTFEDLGNALSKIRIDFGVDIRFNNENFDLNGLKSPTSNNGTGNSTNNAQRGYAIGDIIYPKSESGEAFVGTFVYIKAVMVDELPADIYAYKADHPDFPNESTADQFFDERQFESYRELGYQLTKRLVSDSIAMKRLI